jgi:hypothetical protein
LFALENALNASEDACAPVTGFLVYLTVSIFQRPSTDGNSFFFNSDNARTIVISSLTKAPLCSLFFFRQTAFLGGNCFDSGQWAVVSGQFFLTLNPLFFPTTDHHSPTTDHC